MLRTRLALGLSVAALQACSEAKEPPIPPSQPIQVVEGASQPAPPPSKGSCSTLGLTNIVGQRLTPAVAEQARQDSGAQSLQVNEIARPPVGAPDADRLTLEINANDTITAARCG